MSCQGLPVCCEHEDDGLKAAYTDVTKPILVYTLDVNMSSRNYEGKTAVHVIALRAYYNDTHMSLNSLCLIIPGEFG